MKDHTHEAPLKYCAKKGCKASFKDHHWGAVEATDKGWFHQRNGDSWCPEHHPEWVAEWRARRAAGIPPEPWRKA